MRQFMLTLFLCYVIFVSNNEVTSMNATAKVRNLSYEEEMWCPPCYCGLGIGSRVVGGKPNKIGDNPWMVALVIRGFKFFCGATLIADLYVLTAAHCVRDFLPRDIEVVLSEKNHVDMDEGMADRRKVVKIIIHPGFNRPVRWSNDIALLRLDFPAPISTTVVPACLPKPDLTFFGMDAFVVGWGKTSEDGTSSSILQVAQVPIIDTRTCSTLPGYENVSPKMICAGDLSGGVDACQGDSGGPLLVTDESERVILAGVVSWGIGCARPLKPGVYTRVNQYLSWIDQNTRNACYCI